MQRLLTAAALAFAALFLQSSGAGAQSASKMHVRIGTASQPNALIPGVGKAAVVPFSKIVASVEFVDTGTTLSVSGHGSGFNRGLSYTSFFYGTGSMPTGSLACLPPTPNTLTALQMITAYWLPVNSSIRTLVVKKTGSSYVPLTQVAMFSVRYDSTPTLPLTTNLNPGRYWLNSCGAIL